MTKPYDQAFKLLTEEDPRATLALFAGIPLTVAMDVRVLDREVNLSALQVDNLYRCRTADAEFLVHIEAVTRFRTAALDRQFDYVQAIVTKYRMACRSYLVLLTEKGVPGGCRGRCDGYMGTTRRLCGCGRCGAAREPRRSESGGGGAPRQRALHA